MPKLRDCDEVKLVCNFVKNRSFKKYWKLKAVARVNSKYRLGAYKKNKNKKIQVIFKDYNTLFLMLTPKYWWRLLRRGVKENLSLFEFSDKNWDPLYIYINTRFWSNFLEQYYLVKGG